MKISRNYVNIFACCKEVLRTSPKLTTVPPVACEYNQPQTNKHGVGATLVVALFCSNKQIFNVILEFVRATLVVTQSMTALFILGNHKGCPYRKKNISRVFDRAV